MKEKKISDNENEKIIKSIYFHIRPKFGLLNDPVGLVQFQGKFHVFFQWNPFSLDHSKKTWGHVTSIDLVHWKYEKIALFPSEWYDKDGIYSGSCIVFDNKIHVFYTGNVIDKSGAHKSYQCEAVSKDGINFEKKRSCA